MIYAQFHSTNATKCAYNGIRYTIESIVKGYPALSIEECVETGFDKLFKIKALHTYFYIHIYKEDDENKITFNLYKKMT